MQSENRHEFDVTMRTFDHPRYELIATDEVHDGEPSRWNSAADKRWIPVRPEKVCEVAYDQMEGNTVHGQRFRHAVKFVRWRPDRDPQSCTFDQLDAPLNYDLYDVLES